MIRFQRAGGCEGEEGQSGSDGGVGGDEHHCSPPRLEAWIRKIELGKITEICPQLTLLWTSYIRPQEHELFVK